ncbi:hypothetical protein CU098_000931, partial [Rhizopus stolonifer]
PPSSEVCHCKVCRKPMYLIFQSYAPLPDSPYHRVIYVWGCNRRACMRKEGSSFSPSAAAKNQQAFGSGFQLGDLWGNSASSFGAPAAGGGFGMAKPTAASIVAKSTPFDTKKDRLVEQLTQLNIADPVDTTTLPQFPGQYLYIDEERTDNYEAMGIDISKYKEYLDMEKELLMDIDEGGETWQGETYEKQSLPRGVDKQFKKFTERVEFAPAQCVRYDMNGQPLFYSALTPQQQQKINTPCPYCRGARVFEFQLMPNILSILPTVEYASKEEKPLPQQSKDAKSILDSWNVGMEFGTIMVFVCQKDCHRGSLEDVAYMEETAIIQYEMD